MMDGGLPPIPEFRLGQRVRVRLSGECPARWTEPYDAEVYRRFGTIQHHPDEDGLVGEVVEAPPTLAIPAPGHDIYVRFPAPVILGGVRLRRCRSVFAWNELEPVEDAR